MKWVRSSFPDAVPSTPRGAYLRIRHLRPGPECRLLPPDLLFFDLETLGFLGHPLFLIGAFRFDPARGGWEIRQLFARDYPEEEAVLRAFAREGAGSVRWVSFNGKSFDLPFLRERAAFHRVRLPRPKEHLDLLHLARRLYRGVLPDCRLQTLEGKVLGVVRAHDLPGAAIPAAYHEYVRTGDAGRMRLVLEHNREDLLTLARLYLHLEGGYGEEAVIRLERPS